MTEYKHPNEMTWQELRDIVSDVSGFLIDIAQELDMLPGIREEYFETAVKDLAADVRHIQHYPYKCTEKVELPGPEPLYRWDKRDKRYVEVESGD